MSDRVSGNPGRTRLARITLLVAALGMIAGPLAPITAAAGDLTITTPFPGLVVQPGSTVGFVVTLTSTSPESVALTATGVPVGWTGRFHGGGSVVNGAFVTPDKAVTVNFDLDVPADATAGVSKITLGATAGSATAGGPAATLPLTVTVDASASGDVTFTSDFPELKGPSSSTFTFNLTLKNTTATETTFAIDAAGPDGWTVTAKPSGQAQATSATVPAGGSSTVTVSAQPSADATADTYPIQATATGGGKTIAADMQVIVTGSYKLQATTPDGVLSTSANAGTEKAVTITINNTGTAPVTNVTPTAAAPTGWKVTFEPATVPSIDAQGTTTVVAKVTPSADAITGDYEMTVTAKGTEVSDDVALRVRVETPQFWWIAGIVLIAAVFAGLYWVFRTYGRR